MQRDGVPPPLIRGVFYPIKGRIVKTTMAILLLVACSSCSEHNRPTGMWNYTWTFEDTTLSQAIARISKNRNWRDHYSFKVRNDREFEYLVFKKVIDRADLLREIKSEIHCEIHEAGQSVLIILPKLE